LVPKDNVRRDYGIFDADCLPTWDSIYLPPQSEFFKQIAFYFAPDCEKLAMKQLGFEEYSGHLEKRNVDVQVYRKQRHDWFQSELHDLGLSHYQLNETEWTFVRSSISSFLHQNDSKSFKEEWEIHSSLLYVKQELEKKQRKEKLLKTMDEMGLSVDVLTRCGEEYVETGILPRCFTTIICESEHCFLTSISPTLLHSLCYAGTCTVSQLGHHIAQHHANLKRIEMLIESIVHKRMHGKEYSLEFLVRWIKQVLQKQNPKSVTNSVLTSIVQLVCKKYVLSKQTQQVQDKDFYTKMLHFLESSIETKCPLISKKLLPLYKSFDDPVVRNTVDRFCAAKHRYCTKHLTVCLEYAVSDLASHYRQKQSELYLIKELSKFMPGFEKSGLKAPGSKERYDSAIRLGMWMHVPLNAFRIFREESLYTHLARSIPDFEYKEMLEKSKQTYRQFVLSDSPLSQSNLAEWPKNGEMVLVITQILKDEHHKNCKIQLGNRVLTSLGLDLEADAKLRFKVIIID
jgi:hypothetical protein